MTILKRHSYSAGASDPKARALQEALRKLEKAKAALKLIASKECLHEPWRKSTFEIAAEALKELDDD